jgi:hypothetical protein
VRFYLGTTEPGWLGDPRFEGVPLFVSRNRLVGEIAEVRAATRWALDSGGFTEISTHGAWRLPAREYARLAAKWQREIGRMDWAAPMDWMSEPEMLEKTGKSVVEHQMLTTRSYLELMDIDPSVPWIPVLQGYEAGQYLRHVDAYDRAGVDLTGLPVVGVGSVCRRQDTEDAELLAKVLFRLGLRTHFFGFSTPGLRRSARYLESSDSLAWSYAARYRPVRLKDCTHHYHDCSYCEAWALMWRRRLMQTLGSVV